MCLIVVSCQLRKQEVKMQNTEAEKNFFDDIVENSSWITFNKNGKNKILSLFAEFVEPKEDEKLIDLGCGIGDITYDVFKRFKLNINAIDISEKSIKYAKKNFEGINFEVGDMKKTRFKSNEFDIVLFAATLHHFIKRKRILKEAYRILKPEGRIFAFDPNMDSPVLRFFRESSFKNTKMKTENEVLLNRRTVERELRDAGFKNIRMEASAGITFDIEYFKKLFPFPFYYVIYLYNPYQKVFDNFEIAKRSGEFLMTYAEKTL